MKCPQCGGKTRVIDSRFGGCRKVKGLNLDWLIGRRRKCTACGKLLHSVELLVDDVEDLLQSNKPTPLNTRRVELAAKHIKKFLEEHEDG